MVTEGPHAQVFEARIGKTHFLGQTVASGNIWQAKGRFVVQNPGVGILTGPVDIIMRALITNAQELVGPYKDPANGVPDPSFVLQLPNEVYTSSNLYAIQKSFDGAFQYDVFFDSASNKQKLSCQSSGR